MSLAFRTRGFKHQVTASTLLGIGQYGGNKYHAASPMPIASYSVELQLLHLDAKLHLEAFFFKRDLCNMQNPDVACSAAYKMAWIIESQVPYRPVAS